MNAEKAPFDGEKYTADLQKNWSQAAPNYDKLSSAYFADAARFFLDFTRLKAGARVLDVACGAGLVTLEAAKAVGSRGVVLGVDLAGGMLEIAREKAKAAGLASRAEFKAMSAERLELPDASFDAVICHLGLMLFARPDAALREMRRVAAPGAPVACLVQGRQEKMVFTGLINGLLFKHAPEIKIPGAPSIFRYGPPGSLEIAFEEAGFSQVHTTRLAGLFPFDSPQQYWEVMTEASGRMRSMIEGLSPAVREAFKADVLKGAEAYSKGGRLEVPFEFAMAKALK